MQPLFVSIPVKDGYKSEIYYMRDMDVYTVQLMSHECRTFENIDISNTVNELVNDGIERLSNVKPFFDDVAKRTVVTSKLDGLVKDGTLTEDQVDWIKSQWANKGTVKAQEGHYIKGIKAMGEILKGKAAKVTDNSFPVLCDYFDKFVVNVENKFQNSALKHGEHFPVNCDTLSTHTDEVKAYSELNNISVKKWTDLIPAVDKVKVMNLKYLDYDAREEIDNMLGLFFCVFDTSPVEFSVMAKAYNEQQRKKLESLQEQSNYTDLPKPVEP